MILGETRPTSGKIRVFQTDPLKNFRLVRPRIGYVPETTVLYDFMTVRQLGEFAAPFNTEGYLDRYFKRLDEFGVEPSVKIRKLSKGTKAATSLALELARDPDVLILDEPTSGLDPLARRLFLASVAEIAAAGKAVFLSNHQIAEVERVADQVAFLKNGKFVLMDSLANLDEIFRLLVPTLRGAPRRTTTRSSLPFSTGNSLSRNAPALFAASSDAVSFEIMKLASAPPTANDSSRRPSPFRRSKNFSSTI